jgi:hypothetical protein
MKKNFKEKLSASLEWLKRTKNLISRSEIIFVEARIQRVSIFQKLGQSKRKFFIALEYNKQLKKMRF